MKYLVLDTNIYLHFKNFEQIDWKSLMNDDVTVCVPVRILEEIDKHKDQSRGRIQKRAKALSARFGEIFLQGASAALPIVEMQNPPSTAFDDPQYHKDISDDWIILSALYSSYDKADIVIVAYDNGILIKAKNHGLGFYRMPESLLLKEEPSEEEKQIKELKQQLAKYENRMPKPSLEFTDETSLLTIEKPEFINVKAELEKYIAELKASHPYQSTEETSAADTRYLFRPIVQSTKEQKEEYNKKLDDFFEKKSNLKMLQLAKQLLEQRFRKLDFWLSNSGTSSLGDTTVFITFPADVKIYNQDCKESITLEDPEVPVLKNNLNAAVFADYFSKHADEKTIELWSIDKPLDNHRIKFFSKRLTHMMRQPLESEEDIYIDIGRCGNFTITWIIVDSELINPVRGELHVVVKESEE